MTKRNVLFYQIGQDLCRSVTEGEWKLPKHILLCMTIRHLYRSKQLATILNRLGHCESYDFGLELECVMAKTLDETSMFLTPHIAKGEGNVLFHSEWDNLNKIFTNVHGSNVVNSAGGIMIQETAFGYESSITRSLTELDHECPGVLPSYLQLLTRHNGRRPCKNTVFGGSAGGLVAVGSNLCHHVEASSQPRVLNHRRRVPLINTPPINEPITEYNIVAEPLKRSGEATTGVGQKYTVSTFELGVCMKVLPLIWTFPQLYKDHIAIPGQFPY